MLYSWDKIHLICIYHIRLQVVFMKGKISFLIIAETVGIICNEGIFSKMFKISLSGWVRVEVWLDVVSIIISWVRYVVFVMIDCMSLLEDYTIYSSVVGIEHTIYSGVWFWEEKTREWSLK